MKDLRKHAATAATLAMSVALPYGAAQADGIDTQEQVSEAAKVAQKMKQDPDVAALMQQAKGIFIVPDYGRAALIVGGEGGEGVALARSGNEWNGPVFYNVGGITAGLQAGASAGSVAMLLMSERAVDKFEQDNNFSLDADAGLTIVNYSARAQASTGKGDVILWSDAEGAFAGASIGISDISRDDDEIRDFYKKEVSVPEIFSGEAEVEQASMLKQELSI
ncbi:MAG: lipid-binding SYLF domain-containing protein [Pseudomonadota bacterium]|jgi:lipid-binding SYLF domain-containing protein